MPFAPYNRAMLDAHYVCGSWASCCICLSVYLSIFICSITNHTAQQWARTVEQDEQLLQPPYKTEK